MHWPRRRKSEQDSERAAEETQAVSEALDDLHRDIARARERMAAISEISRTLRRLGERNHFAPLIKDALGGKFQ